MCIIVFSVNSHPRYKFIAAANRDEYIDRPTAPAAFWDHDSNILAGRDLARGGTWLGVTKSAKIL